MGRYSLVKQEDEWGCGAACVASLLGISYREAKTLVEEQKGIGVDAQDPVKGIGYGLELHHLGHALKAKGINVVEDWRKKENFPDGTIACIRDEGEYKDYHYILKTPHGWMDPWHNMGKKPKKAGWRDQYPEGTECVVALVPVSK